MNRAFVIFLMLNVLWVGTGFSLAAAPQQTISTQQLKQCLDRQDDVFLANVLPKIIHDAKHIPGSVNIHLGQMTQSGRLPPGMDKPIVFYCMGWL